MPKLKLAVGDGPILLLRTLRAPYLDLLADIRANGEQA
jgi:hypothetical protein